MKILKKALRAPVTIKSASSLLMHYHYLVHRTSTVSMDPPDLWEGVGDVSSVIIAMWHGQGWLMPFLKPDHQKITIMVSRSADGEILAGCAKRLGLGLIRASGAQKKHQIRKRGGARGSIQAIKVLRKGGAIALTADFPPGPGRLSGEGIIQLARHSGAPILPVAITSSLRLALNTWDKMSINLPFSRIAMAAGELLYVPHDADDRVISQCQTNLTTELNSATTRAHALAKSKTSTFA